jgi:hypothetical protein
LANSRHFCIGSEIRKMALNGTCCAARLHTTMSGPKASRAPFTAPCQWRSNQPLPTHITAEVRPKPNMARLTTSEPKCAQLPTEKTRMMPICSAMMLPATRPTDR